MIKNRKTSLDEICSVCASHYHKEKDCLHLKAVKAVSSAEDALNKVLDAIEDEDFTKLMSDPYSLGYQHGKQNLPLDIENADNEEYYLGWQDGKGDEQRESMEAQAAQTRGNPSNDPYVAEIHNQVNDILDTKRRGFGLKKRIY